MVGMISGAGPDIVWVGLSTPKQERWMAEHGGRVALQALGCGDIHWSCDGLCRALRRIGALGPDVIQ